MSNAPLDGMLSLKRARSDVPAAAGSEPKQVKDYTAYTLDSLDENPNVRSEWFGNVGRTVLRGWPSIYRYPLKPGRETMNELGARFSGTIVKFG